MTAEGSSPPLSFHGGARAATVSGKKRPGTSQAPPHVLSQSRSATALPTKLIDLLPADALPPGPKPSYRSPTSRQSNHSAFSPQGSGGFSPGLLPLRRAHSASKLSQLAAVQTYNKSTTPPTLASPYTLLPYTRDSLLQHWSLHYVSGSD